MVRGAGLEPARTMPPDLKAGASTSFASHACWCPLIDSNDHAVAPGFEAGASTDSAKRAICWYERRESNPHPIKDRFLRPARLPVTPRSH